MDDALGAAEVEDSTDAIAPELQQKFPQVREVYLDVTCRPARSGGRDHPGGEQHQQQRAEGRPGRR